MTTVPTTISRTRPAIISLRSSHRLLVPELTACFASTDSGRAGKDLGGGGCPSILFKALRIELKMRILLNRMLFEYWNVGMLKYWNDGS
jgi:hypothetical protein